MIKYFEAKTTLSSDLIIHAKTIEILDYIALKTKIEEKYANQAIRECSNFKVFEYLWPYSSMKSELLENILEDQLDKRNCENVRRLVYLKPKLTRNSRIMERFCCYGKVEDIHYLLKNGASVTKKVLENAILYHNKPVLEYLLRHNWSINGVYESVKSKISGNKEYCKYIEDLKRKYS
jgi:hypothetical protein